MLKWNKMGLVFEPKKTGLPWMVHHAYSPVVIQLEDYIWRCYFAGRNVQNKASIGFFDIDLRKPNTILNFSKEPVLNRGPIGTFDCDGAIPASVIKVGNKLYMYYSGWNRGWKEPLFSSSVGLAISKDGGNTFEKYSTVPVFGRTEIDPITVMAPCVYRLKNEYIMNYSSIEKWEELDNEYYSWYYTKYATSIDGIQWDASGKIAIPLKKGENHIARMSVISIGDEYEGWYCYMEEESEQYRIGYAASHDGKNWIRKDESAGMELSGSGWDSESQAYPYVIVWNGKRYMFYNGNRFGYDGVGLAIEE